MSIARDLRPVGEDEEERKEHASYEETPATVEQEVDALEILLDVEARENLTEHVVITRHMSTGDKKFKIKIRAINGDEYQKIQNYATSEIRSRRSGIVRDTDIRKVRRMVVLSGVIEPNLKDEKFLEKWHVTKSLAEEVVDKAFLPGEVDKLFDRIATLSGFDDELEDTLKNS